MNYNISNDYRISIISMTSHWLELLYAESWTLISNYWHIIIISYIYSSIYDSSGLAMHFSFIFLNFYHTLQDTFVLLSFLIINPWSPLLIYITSLHINIYLFCMYSLVWILNQNYSISVQTQLWPYSYCNLWSQHSKSWDRNYKKIWCMNWSQVSFNSFAGSELWHTFQYSVFHS